MVFYILLLQKKNLGAISYDSDSCNTGMFLQHYYTKKLTMTRNIQIFQIFTAYV